MFEEAIYLSLETIFTNHIFANPLMNASGIYCMTIRELDELAHSGAGAFITKSCTINERKRNPELRYFDVPLGSVNSMELPNSGFPYYLKYVLTYEKAQGNQNRPLFFSIVGMSIQEDLEMPEKIEKSGFNGITELSLSHPNVPGKSRLAYDLEATCETLREVFSVSSKPLGIKLPLYFDFAHFDQMADILDQFPLTCANAINSVGNGLYVNTEQEAVAIEPKEGFGDIDGKYTRLTVLANTRAFYTRLKPEAQIIGTGGIRTGQDAFKHLPCSASMLQIDTELHKKESEIFSRIIKGLTQIMSEKGYTSIDEFRDKLHTISQRGDEGYN